MYTIYKIEIDKKRYIKKYRIKSIIIIFSNISDIIIIN